MKLILIEKENWNNAINDYVNNEEIPESSVLYITIGSKITNDLMKHFGKRYLKSYIKDEKLLQERIRKFEIENNSKIWVDNGIYLNFKVMETV